jgi:addiction module HigA family antidote
MLFRSVHPGKILADEIAARNLTANALANKIRVPASRIDQILKGKRAITAETALRLGRFLGMAPQDWMSMQSSYDLWKVEQEKGKQIAKEVERAA